MIEIFPDHIEISPSNRATCKRCQKFIGKGEPRLKESFLYRDQAVATYFCWRCVTKKLKASEKKVAYIKSDLERLRKDFEVNMAPDEMKKLIMANEICGLQDKKKKGI